MNKRWMIIVVMVLLIFSLACSALGRTDIDDGQAEPGETTEEIQEEAPAEDEPEVDEEEAPAEEKPEVDEDALQGLDSYRSRMVIRVDEPGDESDEVTLEQAETRDPPASQMTLASKDGTIEFIVIGDQQWINFGDQWMQTTTDEETPQDFGDMFSDTDFAPDIGDDYKYLGKEKVNGINTRHYRVKLNNFAPMFALEVSDIKDAEAEIWIANESDLPKFAVKFTMEATGEVEGEEHTLSLSREVYDVNQPFTIEPPEEAEDATPDDVPIHPDAKNMTSMPGSIFYSAAIDVKSLGEYYEKELTAEGWEKGEETMSTAEMISATWSKDSRELTLMITTGDEDNSQVVISIAE